MELNKNHNSWKSVKNHSAVPRRSRYNRVNKFFYWTIL